MTAFFELPAADEILNSWKDIAQYLNRGVRTVQRWECELALPVHRPPGKSRGTVSALRSEIDQWLSACPTGASAIRHGSSHKTSDLVSESQQLRTDLARLRKDLHVTVERLARTVQCWQPELAIGSSETA